MKTTLSLSVFVFGLTGSVAIAQEDCQRGAFSRYTDDLYLSASSASVAVGDVVPIEVSLTVEGLHGQLSGGAVFAAYDPEVLEIVSEPRLSDIVESFTYQSYFARLNANFVGSRTGATGFVLALSFLDSEATAIFAESLPVPLATLYFRVKGKPGDFAEIRFTDSDFVTPTGACQRNSFIYHYNCHPYNDTLICSDELIALSSLHRSGAVWVLPGEPTQTEPPPLPPLATVYTWPPDPESAHIQFALSGGTVRPGSQIPLELSITSNFEFSGYSAALTFPAEYLAIDKVEFTVSNGVSGIENENGTAFLYSSRSRRRLGAEGEQVHVATLHAHVKEAASVVDQIPIKIETFNGRGTYKNWVSIWHKGGLNVNALPVETRVDPLTLAVAPLRLQSSPTTLGDVNFDYTLNLTDVVAIIGRLYLGGEEVACPAAFDFNEDSQKDISDAVAIITYLYLSSQGPLVPTIFCSR